MSKARVAVVAMSGGVDSSVAAALLLEEGYRVRGVSLRLWDSARPDRTRVCSDSSDAVVVARSLGIPHTVLDRRDEFERSVVRPFVAAYAEGQTPNPCAACNSEFKLGMLLDWAIEQGADAVATGHYARIESRAEARVLLCGRDRSRDQSYFLFELTQRQLKRTLFPLGELTKVEVRERAAALGLPVAAKLDSQDLCFGNVAALVGSRGQGGVQGAIVDEAGRVLGHHQGIERYTIGQRRGLGVATGVPQYVSRIEPGLHRVTVASRPPRSRSLTARNWNWIGEKSRPDELLTLRVRYGHPGAPGYVETEVASSRILVRFERPIAAVAPGQAVVAYRGQEVIGGGWIEQTGS